MEQVKSFCLEQSQQQLTQIAQEEVKKVTQQFEDSLSLIKEKEIPKFDAKISEI